DVLRRDAHPAGWCALPPGLERVAGGGVDVEVVRDEVVALGDLRPVARDDDLRRGGGDLQRGGELDRRLRAEVLAHGDPGQRVAAAPSVGGASAVGGTAAVRAVVGAGGEADGGGGGEGGGQQRAAADQVRTFRIGRPGGGARAPGYGSPAGRPGSVVERSREGNGRLRGGGALRADLLEQGVDRRHLGGEGVQHLHGHRPRPGQAQRGP